MYWILIVEDFDDRREQLKLLLANEFPDVQIDVAASAKEALSKVSQSIADERRYDMAILDFKLPQDEDAPAEVDESVCAAYRKASPNGLVVHYSGFPHDPKVCEHMEHVRSDLEEARECEVLIEVNASTRWVDDLLNSIRPRVNIHRRQRIATNLEYLFGPVAGRSRPAHADGITFRAGDRGISHELAAFKADVQMNWNILDNPLKDRIRDIFEVRETPEGISLSFFPRELRAEE